MKINKEYVDLGLLSGLLWAKCNIGANSPEDPGLYFQWGDTKGYTAEQVGSGEGLKEFSSTYTDYKFYNGTGTDYQQGSGFTKYNGSDGKTVLDSEDDAAHVLMGGNWRLPTLEEFTELIQNTDIVLVKTDGEEVTATVEEYDGIWGFSFTSAETANGVKFYRKDDHSKFIFVPVVGAASAGSIMDGDSSGGMWSSSVYSSHVRDAWSLYFDSVDGGGGVGDVYRFIGLPLRGVLSM